MMGCWNQSKEMQVILKVVRIQRGDYEYIHKIVYLPIFDTTKNNQGFRTENVISLDFKMTAVAIFGTPSIRYGKTIQTIMIIEKYESVSKEQIISHIKEKIDNYKVPGSNSFKCKTFVLSSAGKLIDSALGNPLWKELQKAA
jgi:hypothetical protein